MSSVRHQKILFGVVIALIAVSTLCGVGTHHLAMPRMSSSCGISYMLTTLPQPLQGKSALFIFLGLLLLLAIYPIPKIQSRKDIKRETYSNPYTKSGITPINHLLELFRRGILNPKVFEFALIRS